MLRMDADQYGINDGNIIPIITIKIIIYYYWIQLLDLQSQ